MARDRLVPGLIGNPYFFSGVDMVDVVASLSTAGFIEDFPTAIDRMFSYYLTSEFSQSNLFYGRIVSLQKQIQQYQHDDLLLTNNITDELTDYLKTIADDCRVEVTTDKPNVQDPNRLNITFNITVFKNGQSYSLGRMIRSHNSKVMEIVNINNGV